jgi:hypothetical protein
LRRRGRPDQADGYLGQEFAVRQSIANLLQMRIDRMRQCDTLDRNLLVIGTASGKGGGDNADPGNQREYEKQSYHAVARSNDRLEILTRCGPFMDCKGFWETPRNGEKDNAYMLYD